MTSLSNPFTHTGALRPDHPLFYGRDQRLAELERACLEERDSFLILYGGRRNGKTSFLLRLEERLRARLEEGVRVCRISFQGLPRATSPEVYAHLAKTIAAPVPSRAAPVGALDAPGLLAFLEMALAGDVRRFVLLLDELGTLPDETREDLAHVLSELHTRRLSSTALAKAQVMLAGGIELHRLVVVEASALRNVCRIERLEDLVEAEATALLAAGLTSAGADVAQAATLGRTVYAYVNGHPYLTQCLGARMTAAYLRGSALDAALIEAAARHLLEDNDPLLDHLWRSVNELNLEEAARRLLSASQRTTRSDESVIQLELLGLARRGRGVWEPRNPLLAVALAERLGFFLPPARSIPATAADAHQKAARRYLDDLKREQTAAKQRAPNAPTIAEQVRLQRRVAEVAEEIVGMKATLFPPGLPELVHIPAGPFLMGSSDDDILAYDHEKPHHSLVLPDFWIGNTPVTNAQFRPFVEGDGYTNRVYWTRVGWDWREKEKITKPAWWNDAMWSGDDYPVVGVSWFETVAYCRWLSARTRHPFRLPTEAEWEKAARGPDGRIWPWGNTWEPGRCNSEEAGLQRTTPVGQYPSGASFYSALDMAGNVWEFCTAVWRKLYPYTLEDEWHAEYLELDEPRIRRGGGWYDKQKSMRGAYRSSSLAPRYRSNRLGIRMVSPDSPYASKS